MSIMDRIQNEFMLIAHPAMKLIPPTLGKRKGYQLAVCSIHFLRIPLECRNFVKNEEFVKSVFGVFLELNRQLCFFCIEDGCLQQ